MRTYSELSKLQTFEERYAYLRLEGSVAGITFGHERWLNQKFYESREWRTTRNAIVARDLGLDLGIEGRGIMTRAHVHHMNPILPNDLRHFDDAVLDPEFLITVAIETHNAIHYGANAPEDHLRIAERSPYDMAPWKRRKQ